MSLQKKAISIVIGTFALFVLSLYLVADLVLIDRFKQLESREALANMERARNTIQEQFNFLAAKAADWIAWDDAYQYVQDGNENFRSANLFDANGANMQVNYLIYFNQKGKVVGSFAWDLENERPDSIAPSVLDFFSPQSYFLTHKNEIDIKQSFVLLPKGPAFVISGPVVTGEKKGPIMGTLVLVKYLTSSEVEHLSTVTKLKFSFLTWEELQKSQNREWKEALSLSSSESIKITVQDEFRLAGYTVFFDWEKKPSLALRVEFNRDIMRQGIRTIQTIVLTIVVFGLCFAVALVLLLEKSVLRRITRLAKEAEKVGDAEQGLLQVTIQGSDELGQLSKSINKMLGSLQDQSRNLRAISENAPIGLLRCDASGSILDGYSRSCLDLLNASIKNENRERSLDGMKIWTALGLGKRDAESFEVFYDQVFENSVIGVELIENLPRKINLNDKTLDLTISPIMSSRNTMDSLLFSIADISDLAAVERENMSNQALLRILRNLERFKDLVKRVMHPLSIAANGDNRADSELNTLKRSLHTWKGEFAAFGLKDFVSRIHTMESLAETAEQIQYFLSELREDLNNFLVHNQSILNILPKDLDATLVVVNQNRVDRLRKDIDSSQAVEHKGIVLQFLRDLNHEEASKIFHYLKDGADELARRLEKKVFVQIDGEEVKLPNIYKEVYHTLVHIVRNAIDHGIERPSERGTKNPTGSLRMEAKELSGFYEIRISDDGQGIDLKTIRHIALTRGLTTEKEWAALSDTERLAFVLRNGLSTKRDVTYVSGRGIGLDAVQSTLSRWGGSIKIESRAGWGTSFTIYLPRDVVEIAAA